MTLPGRVFLFIASRSLKKVKHKGFGFAYVI